MTYLIVKAIVSGFIIAVVSEVARRSPGFGALIASLPLVSILGMMWLWHDTGDNDRLADHATATFWFVLPSLPMFLLVPALLRGGMNFWVALGIGDGLGRSAAGTAPVGSAGGDAPDTRLRRSAALESGAGRPHCPHRCGGCSRAQE